MHNGSLWQTNKTTLDFLQLHNSLPNTMILRYSRQELIALLSILVLSNSSLFVYSQSEFDCHITINDAKFDLTRLAGAHNVNRTRSTPPTTMIDSLRFDLCADLKQIDGLAEHDQVASIYQIVLLMLNLMSL